MAVTELNIRDREYWTYQEFGWLVGGYDAKTVERWVTAGIVLRSQMTHRGKLLIHRSQLPIMVDKIEDAMRTGVPIC